MDERKDLTAQDLRDLSGIARQIYAARESQIAVIEIGSLKFTCNLQSGKVSNEETQVGNVTNLMGSRPPSSYEFKIQLALSIVAKVELIDKIKSLNDPQLNKVISKHPVDHDNMNEQAVNYVMAQIFVAVKIPVIARFGLFKPQQTEKQQAVHKALQTMATDDITTYRHVEIVWSQITDQLKIKPQAPIASNLGR